LRSKQQHYPGQYGYNSPDEPLFQLCPELLELCHIVIEGMSVTRQFLSIVVQVVERRKQIRLFHFLKALYTKETTKPLAA